MIDIKWFDKNEQELETLIDAVRICNQDPEMESGTKKCTMLIIKIGNQYRIKEMEQSNHEKNRTVEEETIK